MTGDRLIGGLDIDTYTAAPLRVYQTAYLDAPPKRVFVYVTDHANVNRWLPLVTQVNINRGHADTRDGVGTMRYLHIGEVYTLRQYVIAFDPPHLLAYSIEEDALLRDHVSVLLLEPERYGGTNLLWQHYFRVTTLPFLTVPLCTVLFTVVNRAALGRLVAQFGGRVR